MTIPRERITPRDASPSPSSSPASLFATGCGASATGGRSDKSAKGVRATVRAFYDDLKNGKTGDACDLMTTTLRAKTGHGVASDCGAQMLFYRSIGGEKSIAEYEAGLDRLSITVSGDRATASMPGASTVANLVYSSGHWLLDLKPR
jgi:hypothetical protein